MQSKYLIFIFLFSFIFGFKAQIMTSSPLSYFGLGQKSSESDAIFQSLGYSGTAIADSGVINYNNPATYSFFGTGYTLFSTGIHARVSNYSENGNATTKAFSNLNHIILGMRLSNRISSSFGMRPYTYRGYSFSNRVFTGFDSILYEYKGLGTTQLVYGGLSLRVLNYKSTKLSFGSNIGYLFGSLTNDKTSRIISSNSSIGGIEKRITTLSSLNYQLGLHFQQKINKKSSLDIGASYEPKQNLNGNRSVGLYYSNNIFNEKIYDTISYQKRNGSIEMPSKLNIGLGYTLSFKNLVKNNRKLNSELKFLLNYSASDFSNYQENFDSLSISNLIGKTNRYNIGIQWIPERNYFENNALSKFYQRIYYRTGFFTENIYFSNSNEQMNHFGITFGIGIPIFAQQSLSSINFGVTLGQIEKNIENSLVEKYANLNFGIILSPSFFDKWFRKRKLD